MNQLQAIIKATPAKRAACLLITKTLKVSMTEKELEIILLAFLKKQGFPQLSFPPIIAFGTNAYYPHHKTGNRKLGNNQPVLVDFGVMVGPWCTDLTRTFFFGMPDNKFTHIYSTVLQAQELSIKRLASSQSGKEVDAVGRRHIHNRGYKKAFRHSTGHGLGKLIHQPPWLSPARKRDIAISSGDVVTIEPGIYLKGWGGVRIEDMVLVGKKPRVLSQTIPKRLTDIIVK